ncbi:hypothetical protein [Micromonospora schwarzwaldensis]|uniref:hypothetical protein n=1 Tax=Micromonospora sp. DSM 45708 TaxID=3111767 RepID=UPI0031D4C7D3
MSSQGRRQNPPPVKCEAKSKRTGKTCQRWAVPGRLHCPNHGAYAGPAGRAVAEERAGAVITLAEMMANSPRRPIWEVILDAIDTVDVLAANAKAEVAAGRITKPEDIERVAALGRAAHAMGASAVATKALDMANQAADRWGDVVADRLIVLVSDWLGLPVAGHAVTAAITATLRFNPSDPSPIPRPDGPPLLALVSQAQAAALAPRLGLSAGDLAAWFSRVVDAVADGRPVPDLPGAPIAALPAAPTPEPPSHDSKVAGSGDEEAEPQASDSAPPVAAQTVLAALAEAARSLTLHGQAQAPAEEPEIVDAELVDEPEPEHQPSRIFDEGRRIYVRNPKYVRRASGSSGVTTLGYRGGEPTMPTSRLSY